MDDKKLMLITLGVPSPWFVKSVELNTSEERIDEDFDLPLFLSHSLYTLGVYSDVFGGFSKSSDVYFDFIKGSVFACPICNKPCETHDTKERSWRHLPLFHYESYIHAKVPRTKCEEHGTKTVVIPWSRSDT